jgi:hypothetical protein
VKKTILTLAFGLMLSGQGAFALTADEVVNDLRDQGYTRTEVRVGPSQIKVEAIRGTEKLEVIYDKTTGAVLKSEVATVRFGDNTTPGVSIRDRNRDFVRVVVGGTGTSGDDSSTRESRSSRSASSDDTGGDRSSEASSSDDDHERGHGSDDGDAHDENDDHGHDDGDDSDDDHGSDS